VDASLYAGSVIQGDTAAANAVCWAAAFEIVSLGGVWLDRFACACKYCAYASRVMPSGIGSAIFTTRISRTALGLEGNALISLSGVVWHSLRIAPGVPGLYGQEEIATGIHLGL
jgi:hypothetical protein